MEIPEDPNVDLRKLIYSLVEHLEGEKSASTSTRARAPQGRDSISDSESDSSSRRRWKKERSRSRSFHKRRRQATQSRCQSRGSHSPRQKRATNQSPHGKDRQPKNWADRMSDDEQEEMDFSKEVEWPDSDTEQQESKLVEVSEKTKKLLEEKCTQRVQDSVTFQTRGKYPLLKVVATKTPHLDSYLKTELSSTTKSDDKELAKIQTFMLNTLAPLTSILEADSEKVSYDEVIDATKAAVALIGNANAQISHLRRQKVISQVNKALMPIVEDDSNFQDSAPSLFGTEFAKKCKDLVDQVKAMRGSP